MKKIAIVCLSILLFNCKEKEKEYTLEETLKMDSIARAIMEKSETEAFKEDISGWKYDTIKNKMTDVKDVFCRVQSNESLSLTAPYEGVNFGQLTVRRMNGQVDIIISIMKGQISGGYENEYFKARFDNGKQTTFSYSEPADNSTETIFVEGKSKFLKMLKTSKKVLIEIPLYQNGNQILEFKTEGLTF
ncbi:hypothetical protein SAMN05444372_10989 [Flavobacterium micromati]|jgi:hypothetical protein|uniref:Uncharacterized protein n=1 Tax=Flavobacterium micromati TaxID=229205 RepID=A0A1M5M8V1_9FLAO|nr:hypothetical protein [Flavobacterium micromati]SHG73635.1 hypothetical protein SAMN05444372_10989 [Flavobacterium micromati]